MKQRGSALIYILIAIALLGALTMSFVEPSGQQSRTQNAFKVAMQIKDQAEVYRAAIQDCVITYPAGDTSNTTKYSGYNEPYPVPANSTYLPSGLRAGSNYAANIRCPGNPGDSNSHAVIFGGNTGRFSPPVMPLFDSWFYDNGTSGVMILVGTNKTDAYLWEGIQKAAATYNTCEAEAIDGTGSNGCSSGYKCFRLWIVRNTACP
jgi:type II secretory pathway pseudopilin PulG